MSATALLASVILAQTAIATPQDPRAVVEADVGYEELVNGRPEAAISKIKANDELEQDDPAALINLGNAYARTGQTDLAIASYQAAVASDVRYDLELADGRWMDSRRAARAALRSLLQGNAQAMRN